MKTCYMLYRNPPPPFFLQNEEETNVFERDFLDIGNECFTLSYKVVLLVPPEIPNSTAQQPRQTRQKGAYQ